MSADSAGRISCHLSWPGSWAGHRSVDDFTKEIENDPDNADAYRDRSLAYAEKRDRDLALNDYNRAIELTKRKVDKDRWPE